ncbi:MAG TPA: hypothetical protein VI485_13390 [Vicinamibacterales bacterium]|nr:hypothetical protein [Vicinamibacterales bacterium]
MKEFEQGEQLLSSALRLVAEDEVTMGASAAVEARLRAEVRSLARARRWRASATLVAVAAVVLLAVAVPGWLTTMPRSLSGGPGTVAESGADTSALEIEAAFFPLAYVSVPMTGGQIVRLEMPATTLASFGVAPADSVNGVRPGTVLADVLVGDDGLARGVRFVRPMITTAQ